jgi:hypothetical protein
MALAAAVAQASWDPALHKDLDGQTHFFSGFLIPISVETGFVKKSEHLCAPILDPCGLKRGVRLRSHPACAHD